MEKEIEDFSRSLMNSSRPKENIHGLTDCIEQHKHFTEKFSDYLKDLLDLHATFGKSLHRVLNKYAFLCNDDWNSPLSEFFSHLHLHFTTLALNSENFGSLLQDPLQKLKASTRLERWNELKPSEKKASKGAKAYLKVQKKLEHIYNGKKIPQSKTTENALKLKALWEGDCKNFCEIVSALEIAPFFAISQFILSYIQKHETTLNSDSSSLSVLRDKLRSSSELEVIRKLKTTLDNNLIKKSNKTFLRRISLEKISPSSVPHSKESYSLNSPIHSNGPEASPSDGKNGLPNITGKSEAQSNPLSPPDSNLSSNDRSPSEKSPEVEVSPSKFRIALRQTPISPAFSPTSQSTPPPTSVSSSPTMLTQSPKNMDSFDPFSESSPPASHLSHLQGQASPQNNFFNESNYTPSPILDPFDPFTTPPTLHLSQNPSPISSPQISPQPPALDPFSLTTPIPSSPLCKSEMSSPSTQDTSPFSVSPTSPFISTSPLPPISAPFSTVTPKLPIVLPELLAQELFSAFVIQDQLVKMMVKGQIKAPPEPVPYTVQNPLEWALFPSPSPSVLLRYQHEMEHTALPSLEQFPLQLHVDLQPHSTNLCWNAVLHCAMLPGLALEKITMTCGANSLLTYQGNALTEHTLIPTTFPYPFQFQVDNSSTFIEFQLKWDLPFLISKIGLVHPTGVSFSLKEKCSSSLLVFRYSLTAS